MEYNKIKEGKYKKEASYFEDMWLACTHPSDSGKFKHTSQPQDI